MSLVGLVVHLVPAALVAAALTCAGWGLVARAPWALLALTGVLYLAPVLLFRIHQIFWPLERGGSRLLGRKYSPWWGAHQLQLLYIALPQLEALLRLVPGLYSAWLRLWGSRIGKSVHWTPRVEITDRSLLDIGDRVVFGHHVILYGHVIRPMRENLLLYVDRVSIGRGAFIGAHTVIAPGSTIADGAVLEVASRVYPRSVVE